MVPVASLWLPILVSAAIVFVASSVIHMMLGYHRSDFERLPNEDAVAAALGPLNIPPGEYVTPYAGSPEAMKSDDYQSRVKKGPVALVNVLPNEVPGMGASLAQWFLYCVLVSIFAAYVAGRAMSPGGEYIEVFRFAGTVAFAGYGLALLQNSIWYKRKWSTTLKQTFDGFVYALLTGGVFGWLWPV
jgi:hypothetical protein